MESRNPNLWRSCDTLKLLFKLFVCFFLTLVQVDLLIFYCHFWVFLGYNDEIQVIIELKEFILWCIMAENFDSI